jgi:hypothetical protein
VTARLADDLARLLDAEPDGLSGRELARRVGLRLSAVVAVLREDPRFVHDGAGRGSRWGLRDAQGRGRDAQIRDDRGEPRVVVVLERETPRSLYGAWWRP